MTPTPDTPSPGRSARPRRTVLRSLLVLPLLLCLMSGVAWAFWTTGSVPGGNGASASTAVDQGAAPEVTSTGRTVTVSWAVSTLANGEAVAGYSVQRYDAATLSPQTVRSACTGTLTATTCTESNLPAGRWVYTVTPRFATYWRGAESVRSNPVTVAAPTLALSRSRVAPGTAVPGQAAGFLAGETLRYRLDSPTGPELVGSLGGNPTPAVVPASGLGAVTVTVPSGTSDGTHTVYAVASPGGDMATADVVVDGTPPPPPVLTLTPTAVSGDAVSFAHTQAEAAATVECRLDAAAFAPCDNPTDYAELAAGSHTFQARATDTVGNISTVTAFTWTVNLSVPTIATTFPVVAGLYSDTAFSAGCGTASTGDVCGTADDDAAVSAVAVSLRQLSTGQWWNGIGFASSTETFLAATGTTSWSYAIAPTSLLEGDYTLRARASDGSNLGYDSRTFTVDRTAPATPSLSRIPPSISGPSVTVAFTTTDPTAGFECRLDAAAWAACSSPRTFTDLTSGQHTVNVRSADGAGNVSASTSTTWTVDAAPPTGAVTFPSSTRYNLPGWAAGCGTQTTGDICGTAGDVGSTLTQVDVSIRRTSTSTYWNGTSFATAGETWLAATGTSSWSYSFASASFPADGTYTVRWRATDAGGNTTTGGVDLTLDSTPPPAPAIVRTPAETSGQSVQFDFTTEAGSSAECRMDSSAWAPCTAPVSYNGLASGSHTYGVRTTDAAGNTGATASHTWIVDTGLPSIIISAPVAGRSYNDAGYAAGCATPTGDVCGVASDPGGSIAAVAVSIKQAGTARYWDGTSFASTVEVFLPATGTTAWTVNLAASSFPTDDTYTLHARATDDVGLAGFDTVVFTIDRTPPPAPTVVTGPTGTTAGGATFTFTKEAGATTVCRLDVGSWVPCSNPTTYSALANGAHTFEVRAIDGAGNTGATTSRSWTVDALAPSIGTTFPTTGARYTNATYIAGCVAGVGDLCGTTADAGSGVAKVELSVQRASTGLYLTGTTFSAAAQNWITATGTTSWSHAIAATTFPADGTYTMVVRATDGVGNTRTTSTSFLMDRTKPVATGFTTTNAATAGKLDQNDTFTLTYSEAVAPGSVVGGWTGGAPTNVVVRVTNGQGGGGKRGDKLTVYSAGNTTLLPLGTVNLRSGDYVTRSMTFTSTLSTTGSGFTLTLGTASDTTGSAQPAGNVTWTPLTGATDLAGNGSATTSHTETDLDRDF